MSKTNTCSTSIFPFCPCISYSDKCLYNLDDMDKIRRYEEYHLGKFLMDDLFFNVSIESLSNFIKSGIMDINMRQSIDEAVKLLKLKNIKVEVEPGKVEDKTLKTSRPIPSKLLDQYSIVPSQFIFGSPQIKGFPPEIKVKNVEKKEEKPKFDNNSGKSNPLVNMQILGSKGNGTAGGSYGTGRGHMHHGVDLDGKIGDPVYAMHDGKVIKVVNIFDPNISWNDYPNTYSNISKNERAAGNRINIECIVKDEILIIKYFHLNNVATNPRTGSIFKAGDKVLQGDLIGYIGETGSGSANDSAGPHLHLEIHRSGKSINPEEYFHTKFDKTKK